MTPPTATLQPGDDGLIRYGEGIRKVGIIEERPDNIFRCRLYAEDGETPAHLLDVSGVRIEKEG